MSTSNRLVTSRQIDHVDSSTPGHRLDKIQGEKRREIAYLAVPSGQHPSPKRDFGSLAGHAYTRDQATGEWNRCQENGEFARYLKEMAKVRSCYYDDVTRKGVPSRMKRRDKAPLRDQITTFEPGLSDWVAHEVAEGRDPSPKLALIRNRWLKAAERLFEGKAFIVGYAFHADTDDLHFDLITTRHDGKGGRIGKSGQNLVGPWCVAVDRQIRSGATISATKRSQYSRSVANFRHRYGAETKPLDISLARALDDAGESTLGPELLQFRAAYAARVPELEKQHQAAREAILSAAWEKLHGSPIPGKRSSQRQSLPPQQDFPKPGMNLV